MTLRRIDRLLSGLTACILLTVSGLVTPVLAAACTSTSAFFSFQPWFTYLQCTPNGTPQITALNDFWLILFALVGDGVKFAGYSAVAIIIAQGVIMVKSRGNPSDTQKAVEAIVGACVGLFAAIISILVVQFVASRFTTH